MQDVLPEFNRSHTRITAVGDLMLGDSAICTGYGFASQYSESQFVQAMDRIARRLAPSDIVFGNLECSLSEHGHEPRRWASAQLRGRPGYARGLRRAGFDIVSVANNHASQHGDQAFKDTVALMRDAGVECCGIRGSDGWCSNPVVMERTGLRIGFLGYCLRPRQYSPVTPPYAEGSPPEIASDVHRLRTRVDHIIVSLHWGEEYVAWPSSREVEAARSITDAGAAVILGHHPHVPRPVQYTGRKLIAYSLGNFISDMIWYPPLRNSMILQFELGRYPTSVSLEPLRIGPDYLPSPNAANPTVDVSETVQGISEREYQKEVARTVRAGRVTGYRHAAMNMHRFTSPTLRQLIATTMRNKANVVIGAVRNRGGAR